MKTSGIQNKCLSVRCDTEGAINNQTNFVFPFGIIEWILIVVSSPGVAQKQLSHTFSLYVWEVHCFSTAFFFFCFLNFLYWFHPNFFLKVNNKVLFAVSQHKQITSQLITTNFHRKDKNKFFNNLLKDLWQKSPTAAKLPLACATPDQTAKLPLSWPLLESQTRWMLGAAPPIQLKGTFY